MAPRLRTTLLYATALVALPFAALAQAPEPAALLPAVGVTATRGAKPIDQVPATVSIIEDTQLERRDAIRPSDVVRFEPGVSVGNQPARGGQTNYTIRGIGENRVLVLQDGLRIQDFPSTNVGAGNYTRNFTDLDGVKRVEIVRGPASALYGSDALGGVVNYILKDPGDYLDQTGRNAYFSGKFGYNGSDNSFHETLTGAARVGKTDVLLMYTRRDGHETDANGSIKPNPQTYNSNALLGRVVIHATDADTIRLTGEYTTRTLTTDVRSEAVNTPGGGGAPGTIVFNSNARDTTTRSGLTLDWTHDSPVLFIDSTRIRFSYSRVDRRELSDQIRASYFTPSPPAAGNRRRLSDFSFVQDLFVVDIQGNTKRSFAGQDHNFTYGTVLEYTATTRPRNRTELNLVTGAVTNVVAGETYPNKNFPDTNTTQAGFYLQDEIRIGRLDVTPAVRVDMYDLQPVRDAAFSRSAGTLVVKPLNEVAVSPKLGLLYHITEQYSAYGQYARGFRAPPYDSTNFGFTNAAFGYQIVPNANLKSETSDGVEVGFRGKYRDGSFQLAGFYNHYNNFIDTRTIGTVGGLTQFQYANIPAVQIWGLEARGDYRIAPQWTVRGAFAYAEGEDTKSHIPVDSVDPVKLTVGASWQHPSGFGADVFVTHAWRHSRVSSSTYFKAPSYTALDLMAHYDWNESVTINAGLFNVTNAKYFVSQDVNGLSATSNLRDLYAQPGRYAAVNATIRW